MLDHHDYLWKTATIITGKVVQLDPAYLATTGPDHGQISEVCEKSPCMGPENEAIQFS